MGFTAMWHTPQDLWSVKHKTRDISQRMENELKGNMENQMETEMM